MEIWSSTGDMELNLIFVWNCEFHVLCALNISANNGHLRFHIFHYILQKSLSSKNKRTEEIVSTEVCKSEPFFLIKLL